MNKFYYFSKSKLEFVEIKNLPKKFFFLVIISSFILCTAYLGGYYLLKSFSDSGSKVESLLNENKELTKKYKELFVLYKEISSDLDTLLKANDDLRVAADLPPVSQEEISMGTGGSTFEPVFNLDKVNTKINFNELDSYMEKVKTKFEFEKKRLIDISNKLKQNRKFYNALPAIKPSHGTFAIHGFGMRIHPILRINRMHEGVDILTDVGTPVIASGAGQIDFVGYKGGLGLCVEIDHGFDYRTVYGHLSSSLVNIGQNVNRGQLIAKTGNSGLSSGPHLHYEIQHNGIKQNPMDFIFDDLRIFDPTIKN
jgi:murein DD-endopeptidase MepM/ murein hydrolase activator NlpD